jgi:hypothetical protein
MIIILKKDLMRQLLNDILGNKIIKSSLTKLPQLKDLCRSRRINGVFLALLVDHILSDFEMREGA